MSERLSNVPWWVVSLLVGLGATALVGLGLFLNSWIGWILIVIFAVVTVYVARLNPQYYYRRLASSVTGAWFAISAFRAIAAAVRIDESTFGYFVTEHAGTGFHVVVGAVILTLLVLDFLSTQMAFKQLEASSGGAGSASDNPASFVEAFTKRDRRAIALQILQENSEFFAIDTETLSQEEKAAIAREQIRQRGTAYLIQQARGLALFAVVCGVVIVIVPPLMSALGSQLAPPEQPVTFFFDLNGRPLSRQIEVTFRYGVHQVPRQLNDGQLTLNIPAHVTQVDQVILGDPTLRVPSGPFVITSGQPIRVEVEETVESPLATPEEMPSTVLVHDLPTPEVVQSETPKIPASDVVFAYRNESESDLTLFILDCSAHHAGRQDAWLVFPFGRGVDLPPFDSFPAGTSGWFCFIVREVTTGKDTHLGCWPLFRSKRPKLVVSGTDGVYTGIIRAD